MKKLSSKNKISLILGSCLAAGAILILFFIVPLINKIETSSKNLTIAKQATEEIYQKWFKLEKSRRILNQTQQDLTKIQEIALTKENALSLVQTIEQIAQKTGSRHFISLITPSAEEDNDLLSFEVKVYGDFSAIVNFLSLMENMSYPIQIKSIHIVKLSASNIRGEKIEGLTAGQLKSTINFSVFQK